MGLFTQLVKNQIQVPGNVWTVSKMKSVLSVFLFLFLVLFLSVSQLEDILNLNTVFLDYSCGGNLLADFLPFVLI